LKAPYVIGADWFQYFDEPTHGRYDGENFNFGLVDIHNRPYELLTKSAQSIDWVATRTQPARVRPDASLGVPPAPSDPLADFRPTMALKHWDRERGFVPPISPEPLADLYVCWSRKSLYLGLYAQDVTEDSFYRDKTIPGIDRAEWTVTFPGLTNAIRCRIGAGREPTVNEPAVRLVNSSGINGNFRNIAALELPADLFGKKRFKAGDEIEFSASFQGHCRAYRVDWKGRYTLQGR
ncbi:MAG TPA: hypothetical protein VJS65_04875, partial [Verrucomicrobiae bacterium]|nr:hypothetical protein [Verrucomicrobiae bacterium]